MRSLILAVALTVTAAPAIAQTPARDLLTQASFIDRDRATALRKVQAVVGATQHDASFEGRLMCATATAYRGKLTGSRSDVTAARQQFDALLKADPRDADAQLALGGWHYGVTNKVGALLGRMLGASRAAGAAALDRAVALGGNRAFYAGMAALFRLKSDPSDPRGRQLAEQASHAPTPAVLDRIMQRATTAVLVPLKAGDTAQTKALAHRLLPFGVFDPD